MPSLASWPAMLCLSLLCSPTSHPLVLYWDPQPSLRSDGKGHGLLFSLPLLEGELEPVGSHSVILGWWWEPGSLLAPPTSLDFYSPVSLFVCLAAAAFTWQCCFIKGNVGLLL